MNNISYLDLAGTYKKYDPSMVVENKGKNIKAAYDVALPIEFPNPNWEVTSVPKKNVWTWIKDIFSKIVAFFKSIFETPDVQVNQPKKPSEKLDDLLANNPSDPVQWNNLITLIELKQFKLNNDQKQKNITNRIKAKIKKELTALEKIQSKMKLELLKIIQTNPATKNSLEKCLSRLINKGGIQAPASLKNENNNCYIDSLLQVLFASKSFVKLLKNTAVDPKNLLPNAVQDTTKEAKDFTEAHKKAEGDSKSSAKAAMDAAINKRDAVIQAHIVNALKNYCQGLEAGLARVDINNLRDKFSESLDPIFTRRGQSVTKQNDATEVLEIILDALDVKKQFNLAMHVSQTYPLANNFTLNPANILIGPQPSPLEIPATATVELNQRQMEQALMAQEMFNICFKFVKSMEKENGVSLNIPRVDIANRLKQRISQKDTPSIQLQELIDSNFGIQRENNADPHKDILARYGINSVVFDKQTVDYKKKNNGKNPIIDLQKIIDENIGNPEGLPNESNDLLQKFGIDLTLLKQSGFQNLQEIFIVAGTFEKNTTLIGNAPEFLTLMVKREEGFGKKIILNDRKIEIPQNGIVSITVENKLVPYKVVGVVGRIELTSKMAHYLANVNFNDQWHFVDDTKSQPSKMNSPNDQLARHSRIYVLEKLENN